MILGANIFLSNFAVIRHLRHTHTRILARYCAGILFLFLCVTIPSHGIESKQMKAPKWGLANADKAKPADVSPSPFQFILLGSVRFFQEWVSPVDGSRCSFYPTCSRYGYEAVRDYGSLLGIVMTADRLMRCNSWTEAGQDYNRLPNGTLHDPVADNLLTQP